MWKEELIAQWMPLTFQAGTVLEMLMFCKQRLAVEQWGCPCKGLQHQPDSAVSPGQTTDPGPLTTPYHQAASWTWQEPNEPPPSLASSPHTQWKRGGQEKARVGPGPAPTSPEPGCPSSYHLPPLKRNPRFQVQCQGYGPQEGLEGEYSLDWGSLLPFSVLVNFIKVS